MKQQGAPEHMEKDRSATKLVLPPAPVAETGEVKAWKQPVSIKTYLPVAPDRNPLFLEKRVYQGSSGRVYPLPVIDRIETVPEDYLWEAVHLENEFLRLMILPEIGGRIHVGLDKVNHYDFFYRQNVIKPALVGLAGPWISGGVEFNWPQHHRPATFMPVEIEIERESDGSVTVWCSDHDPMTRMKGMHGICLRPGRAYLEVKVRLYNRTTDTQTFLWWANVATHVNEHYQSFFPEDVRFAADHAKRAMTEYPLSRSSYYGVDYADRAAHGVPVEDRPAHFVPDGSYPANDLGWYANIPVPTSYMIVGSKGDFSGGYDHHRAAGTIAIANHHIAPGKKQWTWGNQEFGYAWDRSLTDSDGPYVELMVGAYTDNQPDFSFLAPGETKSFNQHWFPLREIGVPNEANADAAMRVKPTETAVEIHLQVTGAFPASTVTCLIATQTVGRWSGDLIPELPLHHTFPVTGFDGSLTILVEQSGLTILRYAPDEMAPAEVPEAATEPPLPQECESSDELFFIGCHLEQYRHPTRSPDAYWLEAIRRDQGDSRSNHAMGRWHLRKGELQLAEAYLRASVARSTLRNPNPYDGEPLYHLARVLAFQGREREAYDVFYKSTWNAAWKGPSYHRLAEIDCVRRNWQSALDHLDRTLATDTENLNARNLRCMVLRQIGRQSEAAAYLQETRRLDPLDCFARFLDLKEPPQDSQQKLDLAFDLDRAGFFAEAIEVLQQESYPEKQGAAPQTCYLLAQLHKKLGRTEETRMAYQAAQSADPDYVFPNRIEEMLLLQEAIAENPNDARASYYLGNFLYDRRRHHEAIASWERSAKLDPSFPTTWRNLGIAYFNIAHDPTKALAAFQSARTNAPTDARILYEYDQLLKRTGESLAKRLAGLQEHYDLSETRDDLSVELASLLNSCGQPQRALAVLLSRSFQPWEGGEGLVLAQYVRSHVLLAHQSLVEAKVQSAIDHLHDALAPPRSLCEARHLLMNRSMIDYWLGVAYEGHDHATMHLERAAQNSGDFQEMQIRDISETTFWSGLALARLGRYQEARTLFQRMQQYASQLRMQEPKIDYFATSLPTMLLFEENLNERQETNALFLEAQAAVGLAKLDKRHAPDILRAVLDRDKYHTAAIDLLQWFGEP